MMNSQENALEKGQFAEEQAAAETVAEVQNTQEAVAEVPVEEVAETEEKAVEETPEVVEEAPEAVEEAPEVVEEAPEVVEEAPEVEEVSAEEAVEKKIYTSKQEVLDRIKEIANSDEAPAKDEVDLLKTVFYKLHIAEREQQMKEYLDGGGDPEKYQVRPDDLEEMFKVEMNVIKEKRAKVFQAQEAEKQENLQRKLEIIEKIKSMVTNGAKSRLFQPRKPTNSGATINSMSSSSTTC